MNEVLNALKTRRSIRKYKSTPVPQELIDQVAEAGTYAPTGMNRQSPVIVAVTNPDMVRKLSAMNAAVMGGSHDPFYGAPAVLVVLVDKSQPGTQIYDGSLVMGNLLNAAHAVGLGSCWIHRAKEVFATDEGKALLREWGLTGEYEGIGNCILGYADDAPEAKPRKDGYVVYVR